MPATAEADNTLVLRRTASMGGMLAARSRSGSSKKLDKSPREGEDLESSTATEMKALDVGSSRDDLQVNPPNDKSASASSPIARSLKVPAMVIMKSASLRKRPPAPAVHIQLTRVTFVHLKAINCVEQTFKASVYVEFRIEGGAHDEHLSVQSDDWPSQSAADGSWRPSALWYLKKQLDLPNAQVCVCVCLRARARACVWCMGRVCSALRRSAACAPPVWRSRAQEYEVLEAKIFKQDDDLYLVTRIDGTFTEIMDLEFFPIDVQDLTIELLFKCAAEGPVPVVLTMAPDVHAATETFSQPNLWMLHDDLSLSIHRVGAKNADGVRLKTYPALHLSARVSRRPTYYIANIAAPMAVFSLMAVLAFMVPREDVGSRMQVSLTLVVTAATYKFAMASFMPEIAYLTLLDKYIIATSLVIAVVVFENGLAGRFLTDAADSSCQLAVLTLWVPRSPRLD